MLKESEKFHENSRASISCTGVNCHNPLHLILLKLSTISPYIKPISHICAKLRLNVILI